jgi:hypothetical protein
MVAFLLNLLGPSKKTTAAGIVAFLALVFGALSAELDGDATTRADWNRVVAECVAAASLLFGLQAARDNNVTSENAGAK